jgi:hypothetical protein
MDLTFRVCAGDNPLRYGNDDAWAGTLRELADDHAACVRTSHPAATTADLTVHVWPTRHDEHYRRPIPADAAHYDYPA